MSHTVTTRVWKDYHDKLQVLIEKCIERGFGGAAGMIAKNKRITA